MWFVIIIALAIIIGIVIHKNAEKEKAQKYQEEQERKEHREKADIEEQTAQERTEPIQIEEGRYERFYRGLNTNPIITTAVPSVAAQCVREMVLKQATEPYQKKSFEVYAFADRIKVAEQFIPYAQYGLSSISDDCMCYELAKKAAEVFHQTLCNELTALNTRYRAHINHNYDRWKYYNPVYTVTCEIGFADSRSW